MPRRLSRLTSDRNPFEYGRELTGGELVDRTEELQQIRRTIQNRGKLFVIGPRRFGKTSLLAAATEAEEAEHGAVILRIDAERYSGLDEMASALLKLATRQLATTVERATELLGRFAMHLKPTVSYNVQEGQVEVSLGRVATSAKEELPLLTDVLDAIERMAAETGRTVMVIIDEFQAVVEERGVEAEKQIRAVVQRHRHTGYIFAGSATRLLADMTSDPGRAFYKLGARLFLGAIPREDFAAFLTRGFTTAGFTVEHEGTIRILDLAEDVPYSVQRLAHACWEMARTAPADPITSASVDMALERILRQEDPAYTQLWTALSKYQKRALEAVVEHGGDGLQGMEITRQYNISPVTMQKSLRGLEGKRILRQEPASGAARLRLQDPLFGQWVRLGRG
jgi:uncharacterized protein